MGVKGNYPYIPSVYVVAWPDMVWKVGYSGNPDRWAKFIRKGSVLVDLVEFGSERDARAYEATLRRGFLQFADPAFKTQHEATVHLSCWSGWTECVRIHRELLDGLYSGRRDWAFPMLCKVLYQLALIELMDGPERFGSHIPEAIREDHCRGLVLPLMKPNMWAVA